MRGGGRAPPTLTSQDRFYPHHWMYARKQQSQLCVLCGYNRQKPKARRLALITLLPMQSSWKMVWNAQLVHDGSLKGHAVPSGQSRSAHIQAICKSGSSDLTFVLNFTPSLKSQNSSYACPHWVPTNAIPCGLYNCSFVKLSDTITNAQWSRTFGR